jgi:3D (Asp-Asp-Asp) domain-containing protein
LEEAKIKHLRNIFTKLVNVTAFICIACFIANISSPVGNSRSTDKQVKSETAAGKSPIILLHSTIAKVENSAGGVLNEPGTKTGGRVQKPEQVQVRTEDTTQQKSHGSDNKADNNKDKGVESKADGGTATEAAQAGQWKSIRMRVTAYCPCPKCCGEYSDGITACGHEIRPGDTFVAADGRYAFGTEMLIPGYGKGRPVKVLDRGGAIKGNRLDVFFATHQEALEWGVQYLEVKLRIKNL